MQHSMGYSEVTNNVRVSVFPIFLENQSSPEEYHFLWAYHVKIDNLRDEVLQLRSRYWKIVDSFGRMQEVSGAGVVGEQPILMPGDTFEYTSGTPLSTPSGMMAGYYLMETTKGDEIRITIPSFSLDSPFDRVTYN